MCFGGGGGDSGVAQRAEQRSIDETARVKDSVAKLNDMFGIGDDPTAAANAEARNRIYSGIEDSTRALNQTTLDNEFKVAGRETNFDAARRGIYGGSAYADNLANLQDKRNQGLLKITDAATAAANDARAADDRTRLSIAGNITNGLDESTALSSAANQLDTNAQTARANASAGSLNGFFDTVLASLRNNAITTGYQNAVRANSSLLPTTTAASGSVWKS